MKKIIFLLWTLLVAAHLFATDLKLPPVLTPDAKTSDSLPEGKFVRTGLTIQIAILLDSSNSMDGLIRQAKEQIWNIVNEVSRANKNSQDVIMQIALYEYGKNTLPAQTGYIKMLSPLTNDLDFLSEKLFSLRTRGGLEYAGEVIEKATQNLYWSSHKDDLKIIIIAGNEGFDQGRIDYKRAVSEASKEGIVVNTIFCGAYQRGVSLGWKNGAQIGGGKYMNIDSDMRVVYIPTPYDDQIIILNTQLNQTYIGYGRYGTRNMKRQLREDMKSQTLSRSSYINRSISKSSKQYKTDSWDAVSSFESGNKAVAKELQASNPAFSGKSEAEIDLIIAKASKERKKIKSDIQELEKKRRVFIQEKKPSNEKTFGDKIIKEIRQQMEDNGFTFRR